MTEDSNAGFEFFKKVADNNNMQCVSAEGKNNIINNIEEEETTLIIADGAAFGSEMRRVMKQIKYFPNYVIYLPESFEWLLLKAGIFKDEKLVEILKNPSDYIESSQYFSWERYFTDLLEKVTEENSYVPKYSKTGKLPKYYMNEGNIEKILNQIEKIHFYNT